MGIKTQSLCTQTQRYCCHQEAIHLVGLPLPISFSHPLSVSLISITLLTLNSISHHHLPPPPGSRFLGRNQLNVVFFAFFEYQSGTEYSSGPFSEINFSMESSDDEKDGIFGNYIPTELTRVLVSSGVNFVDQVVNGQNELCLENFRWISMYFTSWATFCKPKAWYAAQIESRLRSN
ncbi:hypothetical protein I3842_16G091500 [Carya illinoinensis]|uniref:Uncharacterized protein n=1 Tax=Carya illinoinensis TaxID=32201 RepID=A0A922AAD0_CARIL|nr:hypothetical protein I3842_16G091500 [Carya illinoinensis]